MAYGMPPRPGEEPENLKDQKPEKKVPDFIYIEPEVQDKSKSGSAQHDPKQMFGSIQSVAQGRHPFYLRILSFLGTFVMIFLSLVVLAVLFITVTASLLFLRQSPYLNEQAAITWKSFKKALVFTLGCFVCIFNLSLGIGIVLMYFMLSGEKVNTSYVEEFTKRQK